MSTPVESVAPPPTHATTRRSRFEGRSRSDLVLDVARHVLLLGWGLVIAVALVAGEKSESWTDAREAVASGEVRTVSVSRELPAGSTGSVTVWVRWREDGVRRVAEVTHVRASPGRGADAASADPTVEVTQAPSEILTGLDPGLVVQPGPGARTHSVLYFWLLPSWVGLAVGVLMVAGLGLLIGGPAPWRATRWAWFWLLPTPVGSIALLALSGPTLGLPGPRRPSRRLTGGWAFLLGLLLNGSSFSGSAG